MDQILTWILDHYPHIAVLLLIAIAAWKTSAFFHRFRKAEEYSSMVPALRHDVEILKADVSELKADVAELKADVRNIMRAFEKLLLYLKMKDSEINIELLQPNSPLQLTPPGELLLEQMGARRVIDANLELLMLRLRERGPVFSSPLDVQNKAYVLFFTVIDSEMFVPVRDYIYNNPVYRNGRTRVELSLALVSELMSVYLRNKYLEAEIYASSD